MMRRQFGSFETLGHLLNYIAAQGKVCSVLICSTRSSFVEDSQSPLHLPPQPPSLLQLIDSQAIQLYFVPTLAHLRVALSTIDFATTSTGVKTGDKTGSFLVVIVNCLSLHVGKGSQGLGQTIALALESSEATRTDILFAECISAPQPSDQADRETPSSLKGWDVQIPVLNSGTSGPSYRPWTSRTISASRVVSQWCEHIRVEDSSLGLLQ